MRLFIGILLLLSCGLAAGGIGHELEVTLKPASGHLIVTDRVSFREPRESVLFRLNTGFELRVSLGELVEVESGPVTTLYRLSFDQPQRGVELRYSGRPIFRAQPGHGGMPQGEVSQEGVYLDGSSAWYPFHGGAIDRFRLRVNQPQGWQVLSQGRRESDDQDAVTWSSAQPHDDIYLLGGAYARHARAHNDIDLSVWLLRDDPELAQRYLALMGDYIDHYSDLIGPYPFAKFAVVENRWPTGLGMPSFTLLGSQVLRLPFIPYTSLPHEILHNWWGNGVWIDYERGNWSEGLTAYLADHWMKERQGSGADYRLRALQRYSNFAAQGKDMRLLDFVSRHSDASQSVGYSKSLMFFHMLRRALGDKEFEAGLRRLWREHRFERVGFLQVLQAIAGDGEIADRFQPWLESLGAPRLSLVSATLAGKEDGTRRLDLELQREGVTELSLDIPLEVLLENGELLRFEHRLEGAGERVSLDLPARPLRLRVDPDYDVLRYLDPSEQPPALSLLFGGRTWLVRPTGVSDSERRAWMELADAWQRRYPKLRVVDDIGVSAIPAADNRLLLGWDNRALDRGQLSDEQFRLEEDRLVADGKTWSRDAHGVVRVSTDADGRTTGFIGADGADLIRALARKLTHYGPYGVLVFDADSAANLYKAVPDNPWSKLVAHF